MPYDLTRFSTQSFERFVQALAVQKFGPITQIFGAGKDGGREATFEGKIKINAEQVWDGYTVVQAKFQEFPGKSGENAAWLIQQIDAELEKFEDKTRALRCPDYYVMVSNGRLSAAAADSTGKGEGGIDKVERHLRTRCTKLGMRGFALWHADTINSLLDTEPKFRAGFEFWITPGDVFSAALLNVQDKNVENYLPTYLRSNFRKSRDVKTKDAGQTTGKKIYLDDIFIDLPVDNYSLFSEDFDFLLEAETVVDTSSEDGGREVAGSPDAHPHDDDEGDDVYDEEEPPLTIARTIVERCSDKFSRSEPSESYYCQKQRKNCVVIMGGPGQGKSTLSQFIAQIYRARLLKEMPGNANDLKEFITHVLDRAAQEGVPLKGPARFPIAIDLPVFADALSKITEAGGNLSLLAYITSIMSNSEGALSVSAVRRWLGLVPTVFILDGLDEVPHSSNRSQVIDAISDLIDALNEANADHFTIVTSRPQGYQNELSSKVWAHWEMALLTKEDALRYGRQLSAVLVPDDVRRQEIDENLLAASREQATAPLMTSPLQVSLLFALVETRNNIPKDRWTLFYRYYEILRDREIAKGGESGNLIGKYKGEIDRLHYETGYLLHLRGEASGGANPFLTESEFAQIVQAQLQKSGYDEESAGLKSKIVSLATTRLVFLRCRTDGEIAFDVRSLQEFMAAARIMASPESHIRSRLGEIAGMAHWLHVFKIACSKVYSSADLESLRVEILAILDSLDSGDRGAEDAMILSGALLAAQMLIDGVPGIVPSSKRNLLHRAMRLLGTSHSFVPYWLEKSIDLSTFKSAEAVLTQNLWESGIRQDQSIRLLILLSQADEIALRDWAANLLSAWMSGEEYDILKIVNSKALMRGPKLVREKVVSALWRSRVQDVRSWLELFDAGDRSSEVSDLHRTFRLKDTSTTWAQLRFEEGRPSDVTLSFRTIREVAEVSHPPDYAHGQWKLLFALREMKRNPSPQALAATFRYLEKETPDNIPFKELPWIVGVAVKLKENGANLCDIAVQVEDGQWGDWQDWHSLEQKWVMNGLTFEDLEPQQGTPLFLSPTGCRIFGNRTREQQSGQSELEVFLRILKLSQSSGSSVYESLVRRWLTWFPGLKVPEDVIVSLQKRAAAAQSRVEIAQEMSTNLALLQDQYKLDVVQQNLKMLIAKMSNFGQIRAPRAIAPLVHIYNSTNDREYIPIIASVLLAENSHRRKPLFELNEAAFDFSQDEPEIVKEAVGILRLMKGLDADFTLLKTVAPGTLKRLIDDSSWSQDKKTAYLRNYSHRRLTMPQHGPSPYQESLQRLLIEALQQATSRLRESAVYQALELPKPI